MNLTLQVTYPKMIELNVGDTVEVHGRVTGRWNLFAFIVSLGERLKTYQLQPSEIPKLTEYQGEKPFALPCVGKVVGINANGDSTSFSLLITGQTLHDFNRLSLAFARSAVPSFWDLVDQRQAMEGVLRRDSFALRTLRDGVLTPPAVGFLCASLRRLGALDPQFERGRREIELDAWCAVEKLVRARRLHLRIKQIDDIRRHLYALSDSDTRSRLLRDANSEATVTFEAAVVNCFSSLDVLGHVINAIYGLGFSRTTATFMNVLRGPADASEGARGLLTGHQTEALSGFLSDEHVEWINEVEKLRHFLIHHGLLGDAEYVQGRSMAVWASKEDLDFPSDQRPFPLDETLNRWLGRLEYLLVHSCHLMDEVLQSRISRTPGCSAETPSPTRLNPPRVIQSFLQLWSSTPLTGEVVDRMYSRIGPAWRKEWQLDRFRRFVRDHGPVHVESDGPVTISGPTERCSMPLKLTGGCWSWRQVLVSERTGKGRAFLVRTPASTPPAVVESVRLVRYHVRQSGFETGYRDLLFELEIVNIGSETLSDVELTVFDRDYAFCTASLGEVAPGVPTQGVVTLENGCVPPTEGVPAPIATVYRAPVRVRVSYRSDTEMGSYWAEDFSASNSSAPVRLESIRRIGP